MKDLVRVKHEILTQINRIQIPPHVQAVLDRVRDAGGAAFVVGGAIRNAVWGYPVTEWDIVTNLSFDTLTRWYGARHPGARFGTVRASADVEITVMRKEDGYRDHRHPDVVRVVADIEQDLRRRDFTVNAVAFDGVRVVAVPDSWTDFDQRRLRTVGEPTTRFREDPLRLLRLARFRAHYGLTVETATWQAATRLAAETRWVSRERRLSEWLKFLQAPPDRWSMWVEQGLCRALEWSCEMFDKGFWQDAPETEAARIVAFAQTVGVEPAALAAWAERWPLKRGWRAVLYRALQARWPGDPAEWVTWARRSDPRMARFWCDLARAAGQVVTDCHPLRLAVDGNWVALHIGDTGSRVGAALRYLQDQIAEHPDWNQPTRLEALLEEWQARE
ncbi:Polynucleotide adenylyltransferase region [Sulfobacillus acidophilus DSM 10332]|uniref:Polynucleotide adenylyltransferase region n=1 Tax=Sulfobacillus acidophilus (strain ATCC 700253 / DSM 10332 / NAL) TaxID=679936 RepID=G8TXK7_SULAD|nr:Polynucleotide adenylyltransferase region [Sulfobacillus acidophilus DSM 10332]